MGQASKQVPGHGPCAAATVIGFMLGTADAMDLGSMGLRTGHAKGEMKGTQLGVRRQWQSECHNASYSKHNISQRHGQSKLKSFVSTFIMNIP